MSAPDVQGGEGGGGEGDGEGGGEGGGEEGTPQGPSVRGSGCAPVAVRCRAVAAERPRGGGLGQWRVPEFVENQNWPRYWFAITFDPPLGMLICAQWGSGGGEGGGGERGGGECNNSMIQPHRSTASIPS